MGGMVSVVEVGGRGVDVGVRVIVPVGEVRRWVYISWRISGRRTERKDILRL